MNKIKLSRKVVIVLITLIISISVSYAQSYQSSGSFGPGWYGPGGLKMGSSGDNKKSYSSYNMSFDVSRVRLYFKRHSLELIDTVRTKGNWRKTFTAYYQLNDDEVLEVWVVGYTWVACESDLLELISKGDTRVFGRIFKD